MMNKEEIFTRWQDPTIEKLQQENKDLQQRIDKAINYIKDFEIQANHINDDIYLDETLSNKLLKILGGKE